MCQRVCNDDVEPTRYQDVKQVLKSVGLSLTKGAAELDVRPATVVSQGHRRSRRVEEAIAEKLGKTAQEIWPERYD